MTEVTNKMLPLLIALDPELFNQLRPEAQQSEAAQKGYQMATSTEAMSEWLKTEEDHMLRELYISSTDEWHTDWNLALTMGQIRANPIYIQEIDSSLLNNRAFITDALSTWCVNSIRELIYHSPVNFNIMSDDYFVMLALKAGNGISQGPSYRADKTLSLVQSDIKFYYAYLQAGMCNDWYDLIYENPPLPNGLTRSQVFLDVAYTSGREQNDFIEDFDRLKRSAREAVPNQHSVSILEYAYQRASKMPFEQWLVVRELLKYGNPEHDLLKTPKDVHAWVQSKQMPKVKAVALPDLMFE